MHSSNQIRIESLGSNPVICVLRDQQGRSLGTRSRQVLEVLLSIAARCNVLKQTPWRTTTAHRPPDVHPLQADS